MAGSWGVAGTLVAEDNLQYGANKRHGAHVPDGDEELKIAPFYGQIGWSFGTPWAISDRETYPYFVWADQTRPHFVVAPAEDVALPTRDTIDLSRYVFSGRGLPLSFSSESALVEITGARVSLIAPASNALSVVISVREGELTGTHDMKLKLSPSYPVTIAVDGEGEANFPYSFYEVGEEVSFTLTPGVGYALSEISACIAGDVNRPVALSGEGDVRSFTMPEGDVMVSVVYAETEYAIAYTLDGGENHPENPVSYRISETPITLLPATKENFRFVGWSDGGVIPAGATGDKSFSATFTPVSGQADIPTLSPQVFSRPGYLVVEFNGEIEVRVYNIVGQLLDAAVTFGSYVKAVPAGLYVVVCNGRSYKIIVK
jgi:hypothetical protein